MSDMDLILLVALGGSFISFGLLLFFILSSNRKVAVEEEVEDNQIPRVVGGRRARLRAAAVNRHEDDTGQKTDVEGEKLGAKKRAKLEAKAEKKAQREAEEREREEKKKKKELAEQERKKAEDREREEEARKEEEERKAQEERERQELEEYLKLKATFNVEEEGFDENTLEDENSLLQRFVRHIMENKVVVLEDLAATFHLKTQAVIDRINDLQANGTLTGVIDDRGKFIYIPREELEAVAKFVKQRGRVSITELAENSQKLINLNPSIAITT